MRNNSTGIPTFSRLKKSSLQEYVNRRTRKGRNSSQRSIDGNTLQDLSLQNLLELERRAEEGDLDAQIDLGLLYLALGGLLEDLQFGIYWLERATERNDDPCLTIRLGSVYESEEEVRDLEKAAHWYEKAASLGIPAAQAHLGRLYLNGLGVPTDYGSALYWFQKAASKGDFVAQFGLGWMYLYGDGVEQDLKEAVKWIRKSALQGFETAVYAMGLIYGEGLGVPQSFRLSTQWYERAAKHGVAGAQYWVGWAYEHGKGRRQSYKKAAKWYRRAADQGDAQAQRALGSLYMHGCGVSQDPEEAVRWLQAAAIQGHSDSLPDEEIAKLAKVALGMPVPDSELTSLEDNHLVFFDAEEPGPHLTPDGHRVIALRRSELASLHGIGPAYGEEYFIRLGSDHAKVAAGENLTIEKESVWCLDTRRVEKIFFGFVFETESGVKGMYHASFLRKTTGEEPWNFVYDWMRIALGSIYAVFTNN